MASFRVLSSAQPRKALPTLAPTWAGSTGGTPPIPSGFPSKTRSPLRRETTSAARALLRIRRTLTSYTPPGACTKPAAMGSFCDRRIRARRGPSTPSESRWAAMATVAGWASVWPSIPTTTQFSFSEAVTTASTRASTRAARGLRCQASRSKATRPTACRSWSSTRRAAPQRGRRPSTWQPPRSPARAAIFTAARTAVHRGLSCRAGRRATWCTTRPWVAMTLCG